MDYFDLIVRNLTIKENSQYDQQGIKQILERDQKYFITPEKHGITDWIFSKGTNFGCYATYLSKLDKEGYVGTKIDVYRTVIYALAKPLQSHFFYWTLLLLILHKFNFKKPVMKIILAHYVFRAIGDILDQLSGLMPNYFALGSNNQCISVQSAEYHPFRWLLTRQIACIFWYIGEICGDWYPLLRTRAVARDQRSMTWVYLTCGLFNLSKIALIFIQFIGLPFTSLYDPQTGMYNEEKKDKYYNYYWGTIAIIIICSLLYDITVFIVLKKQIFSRTKSDFGFLKKFRSISEYRIIVSVVICFTLLPIVFITIVLKFYYRGQRYYNLNFSFEDIRLLIANVQYFMIFIDQILLFRSRTDSSIGNNSFTLSNALSNIRSSNSFTNNNVSPFLKPYSLDSKLYYSLNLHDMQLLSFLHYIIYDILSLFHLPNDSLDVLAILLYLVLELL